MIPKIEVFFRIKSQTAGQSILIVSSSSYRLMFNKCHISEQWQLAFIGILNAVNRDDDWLECSLSFFCLLACEHFSLHNQIRFTRIFYQSCASSWNNRSTIEATDQLMIWWVATLILALSLSLNPITLVSLQGSCCCCQSEESSVLSSLENEF